MSIKDLPNSLLEASKSVIELSELKVPMQIVRGSDGKLMSLAKKAGVRYMKPKPGDDEAHVVGDKKKIMKFMLSRGMSKDDVIDVHPELKEESIEEKKLDPVGKADADIDNDGDTDSSDEYLHKRRAAIKKAMKDEGNKFTGKLNAARENGDKTFTCGGKEYTVQEVEEYEKELDKDKKMVKEKDVKEEYDKDFTPSKHTAGDVSRLDPKEKAGYNKLKAAFIQRNKGEDDMEAAESDEMYNRGKKQKEAANKKLDMLRKQYKASTVKMASSDSHNYGENKESTMMSGKPEKKSIYQVRKDMQKSVKDANQKLRDAEQRKKDRIKKMQDDESGKSKSKITRTMDKHGVMQQKPAIKAKIGKFKKLSASHCNSEELMSDLLPILEKYDIELISEIIGNVKGGGMKTRTTSDFGKMNFKRDMNPKEKRGYNKLLQIAKKLNKAYNDEERAESDEAEERAVNQVYKYRNEFTKEAESYQDSTVAQARKDARKAVPPVSN